MTIARQFDAKARVLGLDIPPDRRDAAVAGAQWLDQCLLKLAELDDRKATQDKHR